MSHKYIFSDASFHPQSKIAVCGYIYNGVIYHEIVRDTTNIRAEQYAFNMAKLAADNNHIFGVDCQKVMNIGQKEGYNMFKIKGHKPTLEKTEIDKLFSQLDKQLRKILRSITKNLN